MSDDELDRLADRIAEKLALKPRVEQRLMTAAQTGIYLGRSRKAVEHMLKKGTLPATLLDSKGQVDKLLLDQLIKIKTPVR